MVALFSIGLAFLVTLYFWDHPEIERVESINQNLKRLDKRTRMDLAMKQEFERTKDPALNMVPRNRLYQAFEQKQQMMASRVAQLDAIPGVEWKERGPNNLGGRTRTIMVDPNDVTNKTVWAASISGGLWKTTDITVENPNWESVNDFFENMAITTLAYDPSDTDIMYFGTGEGFFNVDAVQGNGIWKSTDGGDNWTQLSATVTSNFQTCAGPGDCDFLFVNKIVVTSSGTVLAATRGSLTSRGGVFRSTDGGTSWTLVSTGITSQFDWASDLEIGADGDIYASFGIFQNNSIWKSTDDGATWGVSEIYTSAADEERIEIATAPSDSEYIYALVQDGGTFGLKKAMRSTDGGANWSTLTTPSWFDQNCTTPSTDFTRGQAWYDLTLAVDPNDRETVYIGGVDLFRTTDGGTTWTQMTNWAGNCDYPEVHADQHTIVYESGSSDVIYFGNDGGIYMTENGSATNPTFTRKESGYNTSQFYSIAMDPTAYSPGFIGGTQDNGSAKVTSLGVASIVEVTGGDGGFAHIDQDNSNTQFTAFTNANISRSTDGGLTFSTVLTDGNGSFINPTDLGDTDNNFYGGYTAGSFLYTSDTEAGTISWSASAALTDFNSGNITAVTASPNTSNRVFFGLDNGRVVQVNNAVTPGTRTTSNITGASFPSGSVSCIAVEDGDDTHLLATFSNYGVTSIWETTDGGSNWTAVEGNLPDMPVRWALFNPSNSDQALIATELGVWSTDNLNGASTIWEASNSGLANVRTDMLQIRSSDNLVVAGTHGRGIFTSDIFTTVHADFTSDRNTIYAESSINFTDASYKATSWEWDFGDGGVSTDENPSHTYKRAGKYEVTLTINSGASSETKTDFIHVLPNLAVPFTAADGGNFETNTDYFGSDDLAGGINLWELGAPGNAITTVNSGTDAWKTGLSTDITQADYSCALFSPNFNFTEAGTYTLSFRKSMEVAFANAPLGVQVQYSIDNGSNWTRLGDDISGTNWYDRGPNSTFGLETNVVHDRYGFSNLYTNENTSYDVSFLAGNSTVAFRIVAYVNAGYSAAGYTVDGFMIDDFEISGPVNEANVNITQNDPGTHLSLNGSSDYISLSNLAVNESFTVEMWVNPSSTSSGQTILAKHDASGNDIFKVGFAPGGIEVDIRGTSTSGGTKETGLQHLAIAVNKTSAITSQITVYKDGVQAYSNSILEVLGDPDGLDWVIGQDWDGVATPSDYFGGTIDELRIWNSVRTQNEIRENMFLIVDGLDTDLKGYWQFNENTGSNTENIITGNQATLVGAAWETSTSPVAKGTSYTATVNSSNTFSFGDLSIDFTGVIGSINMVVFELESNPIGTLPDEENTLTESVYNPYYNITTYGLGTFISAELTYTYGAGAFTETDPNSFLLFKRGSKSNGSWGTIVAATSVTPATGVAVFDGITSFSQTTTGASAAPLPVDLIDFTVSRNNHVSRLAWSTATETNNEKFEILRKAENDWEVIYTMNSLAADGNSNQLLTYEFTDQEAVFTPEIFYQLRQVDFDGTATLSQIERVGNETDKVFELELYPNPFVDRVSLSMSSPFKETGIIEILNLNGQKVRFEDLSIESGASEITLDLKNLEAGIYILRIKTSNQTLQTKLVKR